MGGFILARGTASTVTDFFFDFFFPAFLGMWENF